MGKYLKKFELTAQYEEYINSAIASLPNISIVKDNNNMIHYNHNYLKFTAEENNSTISLNAATSPDIKYSLNGGAWIQWDYNAITLKAGDTVRMKGNNSNGFSTSRDSCNQFQMTGKIGASGNIMSLLYGDAFERNLTIPCAYCYVSLFMNCTSLTKAPALPAKILTNNCYDGMFYGCTALTTAPKLPATTLASYCYNGMFYGCTALTTVPDLSAKILANYCCSHMFNNCSSLINAPALPATTLANDCYYGMFYNCTALITAPELPATTLADECYSNMFYNCTALTTAPVELPATTLARSCYQQMFQSCSSLTTAPKLPATTLAYGCYTLMFNSCSSLTTAPELPAETLVEGCYQFMFGYCSKLNYIKMLATDISANSCLIGWLNGVASTGTFIKHPNMTSLSTESDSGIPRGWTVKNNIMYLTFTAEEDNSTISLNATTSPDIKYSLNGGDWTQWDYNAITLNTGDTVRMKGNNINGFSKSVSSYNKFQMTGKIGASGNIMSLLYGDDFEGKITIPCVCCFYDMFEECTSLTTAPELPAMTLTDSCYSGMFSGCTSLTTAPELPATTLATGCYSNMFYGCTSLITAPELPSTTLVTACYAGMFWGCYSLTTAPTLPAATLVSVCYQGMFYGCTKLNYIKMLATDISAGGCLAVWVENVSSTGTFVKHPNMTSLESGPSGIPNGWTVQNFINYLKFTAEEDYSRIALNSATNPDIKYSLNDGEWIQWNYSAITLNTGDNVRMKGNNSNGFSKSQSSYNYFDMTGKISASGNIMSLLYEDDFEGKLTIPCEYCFYRMFNSSYALTTAPKLPATTLTDHCYDYMFSGCSSLTAAPKLPATTLKMSCYYCMFQYCSSLTTAPELPATTLADSCYINMFMGCTSLTTAPELPATTLDGGCYLNMFSGCSSLTAAPELPAATLTRYCYSNMFNGCSKINYIKMLATDVSADSCLSGWVNGVASTGTFVKHKNMSSLKTGYDGIPKGWTVQNAA